MRRELRKICLEQTRRETLLIFMRHPHDDKPITLGRVPYHLHERGPHIPIEEINGEPVLTFEGRMYEIRGYGIEGKTNGILGPWPPPLIRLETGADEVL